MFTNIFEFSNIIKQKDKIIKRWTDYSAERYAEATLQRRKFCKQTVRLTK